MVRDGVFQKQKQNCGFVFVFATPLGTALARVARRVGCA